MIALNVVTGTQNMGPACAVVNFRSSFLFLSFLVVHQRVMSDLTCKPMDSESLVNETTYFNCSSSITAKEIHWYHYPVGVEAHERKSVYAHGKFYEDYATDFVIEKNSSTGMYDIVIRSVTPSYAGRFECQDNGGLGNSCSAQLIVLDDEPECSSNINPDGVIGSNACGIQPEELHLSCSISYHGSIPPELKWVKLGENDSISGNVSKDRSANPFTYNLTVKADLLRETSSFECHTTKSRTSKHSCSSEIIKPLYIFSASSVSVKNIGEVVNCSANTSSQSCQYKWKWYNKEDSLTVSDNRILKVEKEGQHRCEATCILRDKQCTVNAILINATLNSNVNGSGTKDVNSSTSTSRVVGLVVGMLLVVIIVIVMIVIVLWIHRRRNSKHIDNLAMERRLEQFTQEECSLLPTDQIAGATEKYPIEVSDSEYDDVNDVKRTRDEKEAEEEEDDEAEHPGKRKKTEEPKIEEIDCNLLPELLHVESLKSANDEKTVISGLTVLDKELFIVLEKESEVKVFQAIAFIPVRSFSVMDLDKPLDIVSSLKKNCLYISSPKEIYNVDASGKVIAKWPIEHGGGTLSVTHDQTIVLSDWKRTALREYSADGQLIHEVRLPSDVHPFHAIKRRDDQFVISFEHRMVHTVAIVDTNGCVIQSLVIQSLSGMLKFPKYLVVNSDGYIFVADRNNSRVLMMNPTLESSKVILSDKDKLYRPLRICLDEENSQMFVADIKGDNPRFMVFRLQKHKTGANEDIAMKEAKPQWSNQNLKEDLGATEATAVTQDKPLASNCNIKEDSGGIEDKSVIISDISGNEEEEDEFHDAEDTLEQSRGEKRKR